MTNLIRGNNPSFSRYSQNFDILSDPTRLCPNRDMAASAFDGGLAASTAKLSKFLSATTPASDGTQQYALGVISGDDKAKIFQKSVAAGGTWVASATAEDSDDGVNQNLFVEYQGIIYGANEAGFWGWKITDGTFTTTANAVTYTGIFQGLVHSKDDILYIPYYDGNNGFIAKKDGGAVDGGWTDQALILPSSVIPICIAEYGNFLAIACKAKNTQSTKSFVYLWDRDSSLTTLTETIDWGRESLEMIEEVDGTIVGVSVLANTSTETITIFPKLIFKAWTGGPPRAKKFLEIPLSATTINNGRLPTVNNASKTPLGITRNGVAIDRFKIDNRILFPLSVEFNGTQTDGIWSITRLLDGTFSVSVDRLYNNDTAVTTGEPKGMIKFGDYVSVAFDDGGTYKVTETSTTYTNQTSKWETIIFGETYLKYKLKAIGVMTQALPTAGTVVIGYKKDEETSFTQIFSHGTDSSLFHESVNIEGGGALPEFRELSLEIQSTGNAVVTGIWIQAELVNVGLVNRILTVIRGWL